jgi:choline-sulfatase
MQNNRYWQLIFVITGTFILLGLYSFVTDNSSKAASSMHVLHSPTHQNKKRINILFLMADQHRGDCIGAAGAEYVSTPNLDRLAKEGILFTRAYSSVPSCTPARTSILTGMSPWKSGQIGYTNIPNYPFEGPAIFTSNGYTTHAIGKNHFYPMRNKHGYQEVELEEGWYTATKGHEECDYTKFFQKNAPGKDINQVGLSYNDLRGGRFFPFEEYLHPTYWTADRAIQFLNHHPNDEPWLLKVSFQRPHSPLDPPKRFVNSIDTNKIQMPSIGEWAERKFGKNKSSMEINPNASNGVFPDSEIKESRKSYYEAISYVDDQIGRVIQALRETGELENTLILYTSDHGDLMGDHHLWRKCRPYEGSTRIPMIVRWPASLSLKAKRGQISTELVELRDVFPTFLDASGIKIPEVMDGRSMLDIVKGNKWRTQLEMEHAQIYEPDNAWVALTDKRYKYIYFTLTGAEQLFDLKTDPNELNELASSLNPPKKLLADYRTKMVAYLKERGEEWVKNDQLVIQPKPIYVGVNRPKTE